MSSVVYEQALYSHAGTDFDGLAAYKTTEKSKLDAVVIFPDAMGQGAMPKAKATALAELGYLGFAADLFGVGIKDVPFADASKYARPLLGDQALLRGRALAAVARAREHPLCSGRVVVIGFCMGGKTSLEVARTGIELSGAVSFHGGLGTDNIDDGKNVKCPLLVFHGGLDPFVPVEQLHAFEGEVRLHKLDCQIVVYETCYHSFTTVGANMPEKAVYDKKADQRSWIQLCNFLTEVFA